MTDIPSRVLIIGIDAATMDLIRPWAEAGELPAFHRLFRHGTSGLLRSVPNCNSAPAWTSMVTGKNPGKHGIVFFTQPRPGSLKYEYVNGSYREVPAIWNLLSQSGKRVGVVNVPMTYPAEAVNGFMISGIDAPGVHDPRFIYPRGLYRELQSEVGEYVIEAHLGSYLKSGKVDQGVEALYHNIERRLAAVRYLLVKKPWDFFMVVFRTTDPAQHYFWKFMQPEGFQVAASEAKRYGDVIKNVYKKIDLAVGELVNLAGPHTVVFITSDHGAAGDTGKSKTLSRWLEAIGVLKYVDGGAEAYGWPRRLGNAPRKWGASAYRQMDRMFGPGFKRRLAYMFPDLRTRIEAHLMHRHVDWEATQAFSDGTRGEIWINVKGRQPFGTVEPGQEYKDTCAYITHRLCEARDAASGKPVVKSVHHRDDVYNGPYVDRSPDLIIEWQKGSVPNSVALGSGKVVTIDLSTADNPLDRLYCGTHDPMGILFMAGGPVRRGFVLEGSNIMDIAPTILYLFGQPVPDDMDGRILLEAFEDAFVTTHPPATGEAMKGEGAGAGPSGYSEEDEAVISERLRGLGYIE